MRIEALMRMGADRPEKRESQRVTRETTAQKPLWMTNQRILYPLILFWILLSFVLNPLISETGWGKWLLIGISLAVLGTGFLTITHRRKGRVFALLLLLATFGLRLLSGENLSNFEAAGEITGAVLLVFLGGYILVDIFGHPRVNLTTVCGALCVYLFIGSTWTGLYTAICIWEEEPSFRGLSEPVDPTGKKIGTKDLREELQYFSMVTLTSLGYGDIVPTRPISRSLAFVEAILGQLYLVVLVSRLVSLYGKEQGGERQSRETESGSDTSDQNR